MACPVCGETTSFYVFRSATARFDRCKGCGLTWRGNLFETSQSGLLADATGNGLVVSPPAAAEQMISQQAMLAAFKEVAIEGPILIVGSSDDPTMEAISAVGGSVRQVLDPTDRSSVVDVGSFAAAVILPQLMQAADPLEVMRIVRGALRVDGRLFMALPLLDTRSARFLGRNWQHWNAGYRFYFTRETLHLLLLKAGFEQVWFRRCQNTFDLATLDTNLLAQAVWPVRLAVKALGGAMKTLGRVLPRPLRHRQFSMPSSRVLVTATAAAARPIPLLSIILPVYNEQATFAVLIERVLAKSIPGVAKELVVVESNSTDGTRDLAMRYANHPDVRLILQDRPTGKGSAVRAGLAAAAGDMILIQDADLEYDIDDYDELLQPLLNWRSIFILGSRHRGDWKMRQFNDAPFTAAVLNLGHVFFTAVLNILLGKNLSDPFTMFKVFRRDAVYGLKFICNRFDFDHEMVIKLVRKGYNPVELPVNYSARSMAEGKKVSFVKDGLTWLWIDLKLRYGELGDRPH